MKPFCSCIIPSFYIKPQHVDLIMLNPKSCIIPSFYIKPQPKKFDDSRSISCIIPSFYIKPQPVNFVFKIHAVVLYLHSTSNHNLTVLLLYFLALYYTFILHQTTTLIGQNKNSR